jgi:hypothetical protein
MVEVVIGTLAGTEGVAVGCPSVVDETGQIVV